MNEEPKKVIEISDKITTRVMGVQIAASGGGHICCVVPMTTTKEEFESLRDAIDIFEKSIHGK